MLIDRYWNFSASNNDKKSLNAGMMVLRKKRKN